jgi:hypothetical protein
LIGFIDGPSRRARLPASGRDLSTSCADSTRLQSRSVDFARPGHRRALMIDHLGFALAGVGRLVSAPARKRSSGSAAARNPRAACKSRSRRKSALRSTRSTARRSPPGKRQPRGRGRGPTTMSTTMAPSSSIPTATTSRPCVTSRDSARKASRASPIDRWRLFEEASLRQGFAYEARPLLLGGDGKNVCYLRPCPDGRRDNRRLRGKDSAATGLPRQG